VGDLRADVPGELRIDVPGELRIDVPGELRTDVPDGLRIARGGLSLVCTQYSYLSATISRMATSIGLPPL
jgi:hypothetical protein